MWCNVFYRWNITLLIKMQIFIVCNNLRLLIYGLLFVTHCHAGRIFGKFFFFCLLLLYFQLFGFICFGISRVLFIIYIHMCKCVNVYMLLIYRFACKCLMFAIPFGTHSNYMVKFSLLLTINQTMCGLYPLHARRFHKNSSISISNLNIN